MTRKLPENEDPFLFPLVFRFLITLIKLAVFIKFISALKYNDKFYETALQNACLAN